MFNKSMLELVRENAEVYDEYYASSEVEDKEIQRIIKESTDRQWRLAFETLFDFHKVKHIVDIIDTGFPVSDEEGKTYAIGFGQYTNELHLYKVKVEHSSIVSKEYLYSISKYVPSTYFFTPLKHPSEKGRPYLMSDGISPSLRRDIDIAVINWSKVVKNMRKFAKKAIVKNTKDMLSLSRKISG